MNSAVPLSLLLAAACASAQGASGSLDLTFNSTGSRTVSVASGYTSSGSYVAVQSDGKIVMAGADANDFAISRFLQNGSPDSAFGTAGVARTDFGTTIDIPRCIAITTNGKIVVGGGNSLAVGIDTERLILARYLVNGALDTTFGNGGKVTTNASNPLPNYPGPYGAVDLIPLPDGKILVLADGHGDSTPNFILLRYNPDGTADYSFGVGGRVTTDFSLHSFDQAFSFALQQDGKILVTGSTTRRIDQYQSDPTALAELALLRFTADGTLDTTFGQGGKVTVPVSDSHVKGRKVFAMNDGRIIVAGSFKPQSGGRRIIVCRFTGEGTLDTRFGSLGQTVAHVPEIAPYDSADFSLAGFLQRDGRLVVATNEANNPRRLLLFRFGVDGSTDANFGSAGQVATTIRSSGNYASSLLVQNDGKLLVSGHDNGSYYFLVRYQNALAPSITTLPATDVTGTAATLRGIVNANAGAGGGASTASFFYGTDSPYSQWNNPTPISGSTDTAFSTTLTGLTPGADYYFYAQATGPAGTTTGPVLEFTTPPLSNNANLAGLTLNTGGLTPAFSPASLAYTANVPHATTSITIAAIVENRHASVRINDLAINANFPSRTFALPIGESVHHIAVTAQDGTSKTYTLTVTRAPPAPGTLDLSFNGTGTKVIGIGQGSNSHDSPQDILVLNNAKIFGVGYSGNVDDNRDFSAFRCLPDGTLDATFGSGGTVITPVGSKGDWAVAAAEQPDGKVVVAGHTQSASSIDFAVVRYNLDGSLDRTFGNGGKVITPVSADSDRCCGVAMRWDGKIIVAGTTHPVGTTATGRLAVVSYNPDGSLDGAFGSGGILLTNVRPNTNFGASDLAILPDGKCLVVGGLNGGMAVARITLNGTWDSTFGVSGLATTNFPSSTVWATCVAVQPDGMIVVVGERANGFAQGIALARFSSNGTLDRGFGSGGKVADKLSDQWYNESVHEVAVQLDGRILVVGTTDDFENSQSTQYTKCYLPNGKPDTAFGANGKVAMDYDSYDFPAFLVYPAVALQPDGRIFVLTLKSDQSDGNFLLLRYHGLPYQPNLVLYSPENRRLASGASWPFPTTDVGLSQYIAFQLLNIGAADAKNIRATIEGRNAADFSVLLPPANQLAPGPRTTFVIRYSPRAAGAHTASLRITCDEVNLSPIDLTLKGSGISHRAPPAKTLPATAITTSTAILHGSINPRNTEPTVWFDYGVTPSYGVSINATPAIAYGDAPLVLSAILGGLAPHTKYYYRLRGLGSLGQSTANGLSFTTATTPPVATDDTYLVTPFSAVHLDVLANDSDADGDALTLVSVTAPPAAQGKVAKVNNKILFTASSTFDGTTLRYTTTDNFGGSSSATVTVLPALATMAPPSIYLPSAGSSHSVTVSTSGLWSVAESLSWITSSITGPNSALITVLPNPSKMGRAGTVMIAGRPHLVNQAGVLAPTIVPPATIPLAIVGGGFEFVIPATNPPVIFSATGLPPGLKIEPTLGVIQGIPTKAGSYFVTVTVRNSAGTAVSPVFGIPVSPLPQGVVGVFNGYFPGAPSVSGLLGYRCDLTTSSTGAITGKLTGAGRTWPFKGAVDSDPADPTHPTCALSIARPGYTPLSLVATFDADTDSLTGLLSSGQAGGSGQLTAWRQTWNPVTKRATLFKGAHSFYLDPPNNNAALPQGRGFGYFIVDEKTGSFTVTGKLADGNSFTTASFLGAQGQVLVFQPLYSNLGLLGGVLTLAADHSIAGPLAWYKPDPSPTSRDLLYRAGFGPVAYTAHGGLLPPITVGGVLLDAPNVVPNATLAFEYGALSSSESFSVPIYLQNPRPTGLTNIAFVAPTAPNKVTLPVINTSSQTFSGDFTLAGATPAANRKATFHGQVVWADAKLQGHGFFILSEPVTPPQTPTTAPRLSDRVLLRAAQP